MNLRNEKGSITVFVVASCMLFIIVALGISNFIQNKSNNEEEQYREIKKSYEKDIGNEDKIYDRLKNNIPSSQVAFDEKQDYTIPTDATSVTISQKFTILDNSLVINSLDYKWFKKNNEVWEEIDNQWISLSKLDKVYTIKKDDAQIGIYALKIRINEEEIYNNDCSKEISVKQANVTVTPSSKTITFSTELKYNFKVGTGQTSELAKDSASSINVTNNTYNYGTMTLSDYLYAEATDSYGNKVYISKNLTE